MKYFEDYLELEHEMRQFEIEEDYKKHPENYKEPQETFNVGQKVRIINHPFQGKTGVIKNRNKITGNWLVKFKDSPFTFGFKEKNLKIAK